ncbi:glycosyltransferase family 9 protein, partial [Acidobacteriota bacterium]
MSHMKLLVRAPNWIGDAVMSIPALACFSRNNPKSEIWLAGTPWVKDVFRGKEYIRGSLVLSSRTSLASLKKDARMIREEGFDAGLLLTNSFASALMFAMARIPQRWGYNRDGRGLLLTQAAKPPAGEPKLHQVHYYTHLVEQLGGGSCTPELSLDPDEDEIREATKILLSEGINPEAPIV